MDSFGTLEGRQDYTIHGQLYARLFFSVDGDKENIIPASCHPMRSISTCR